MGGLSVGGVRYATSPLRGSRARATDPSSRYRICTTRTAIIVIRLFVCFAQSLYASTLCMIRLLSIFFSLSYFPHLFTFLSPSLLHSSPHLFLFSLSLYLPIFNIKNGSKVFESLLPISSNFFSAIKLRKLIYFINLLIYFIFIIFLFYSYFVSSCISSFFFVYPFIFFPRDSLRLPRFRTLVT